VENEPSHPDMTQRLQIVSQPHSRTRSFARIEDAIAAIRAGQMVIVVDDEDRENEGDLTIAAEKITPEAINFMAQYGRGLICLAMTPENLDALEIPLMVSQNSSRFETAFCVSVEARERTTTGISAADRAATILAAINPATKLNAHTKGRFSNRELFCETISGISSASRFATGCVGSRS